MTIEDKRLTQAEFAQIVGIDLRSVARWCASGRLTRPLTLMKSVAQYCQRLREQAAGRQGENDSLSLAQERAALARAQREHVQEKLAVLRREYAPIQDLERVLSAAVQAVCDQLDQLPARIAAACPELPPAAVDVVMSTIAAARDEWAATTLDIRAAPPTGDADAG